MFVREMAPLHLKKVSDNKRNNNEIIENYGKMIVAAILAKAPKHEIEVMKKRKKRMEGCNNYWLTETYENSKVKRLVQTYLCHDRFCFNCSRIRQYIMKTRFLPHMERYSDSLYHIVLTVPDCTGEELGNTLSHMGKCFKTLVNYLNGNQKMKQLDFSNYGFQGCIRSLEIMYKGMNTYHPHYHIAAVFDNPEVIENKYINNIFSKSGKRLFSDFEAVIQRMWWLIINRQHLTSEAIYDEGANEGRYSCIMNRFQPADCSKLFGYMTKTLYVKQGPIHFDNFKVLYNSLKHVRQIQGYGVFYNVKAAENDPVYTEREQDMLADYITLGEKPTISNEPLSRLAKVTNYKILKKKYSRHKDII